MLQIIILGRAFSGSILVIIIVLGRTRWMGLARMVHANMLSLKNQEFVLAARTIGASDVRIIFQHILANTLAPMIVSATLGISTVILVESYVSFLGLGCTATYRELGQYNGSRSGECGYCLVVVVFPRHTHSPDSVAHQLHGRRFA